MSRARFEQAVKMERLSQNCKVWFPRWLGRYAAFIKCPGDANLPVDRQRVISFLRMLRDGDVLAWQRLQAVEAIECYQSVVARDNSASLKDVRLKLIELAQRERNSGVSTSSEQDVGQLDSSAPTALQDTLACR